MRSTIALVLLLAAGPALSQDCLVELQGCTACLERSGSFTVSDCGGSQDAPGLPPELLERPEVDDLDGVHGLVARAILTRWDDVLAPLLVSENRIYVPREMFRLAIDYPGAAATTEDMFRAAENAFIADVIGQASTAYVVDVSDGEGGHKRVIRSHRVLVAVVLSRLDDAGAFDNATLPDPLTSAFDLKKAKKTLRAVLDVAACLAGYGNPDDAQLAADAGLTAEDLGVE